MKNKAGRKENLDDHLGCFGDFNANDPVCKKLCVLNLRCIVENEENARLELLEELVTPGDLHIKLQ